MSWLRCGCVPLTPPHEDTDPETSLQLEQLSCNHHDPFYILNVVGVGGAPLTESWEPLNGFLSALSKKKKVCLNGCKVVVVRGLIQDLELVS